MFGQIPRHSAKYRNCLSAYDIYYKMQNSKKNIIFIYQKIAFILLENDEMMSDALGQQLSLHKLTSF